MRLNKYICVFMAVTVFFTGCADSGADQVVTGTEVCREGFQTVNRLLEETYTVEMAIFQSGDICVEYPQIKGLWDKEREEKLNGLIWDHLFSGAIPRDSENGIPDGIHRELECRVTLQSGNLLSFYYIGDSCRDGGKPRTVFYSLTLDIKKAEALILSDLVSVDRILYDKLQIAPVIMVVPDMPGTWYARYGLLRYLREADGQSYFGDLQTGENIFALEKDALIVARKIREGSEKYVLLVRLPGRIANNRFIHDPYMIETAECQSGDIYAEYPQILGLAEKTKENNINRLIAYHILGDKIGRPLVFQNVNGLHMELESRVTHRTSGFFSFYCTGKTYLEGDRPTDVFYSMTFDMKEAKELILSDLVDIDETLVDRIKNSTDITNQKLEENPDNETLRESLLAAIQEKDTLQYMEFLAEWEDRFVLEQNALIVTMEVSPDDGDYVLIRLPGQMEGNRFIFDET